MTDEVEAHAGVHMGLLSFPAPWAEVRLLWILT